MFENKYKLMASLGDTMDNMKSISSVLTASLIACIIRIVVGALMVTTSLVENDISDSTYEHAMLRCLGWTQNYTKMIVMIKSLAFQTIPGAIAGSFIAVHATRYISDELID